MSPIVAMCLLDSRSDSPIPCLLVIMIPYLMDQIPKLHLVRDNPQSFEKDVIKVLLKQELSNYVT